MSKRRLRKKLKSDKYSSFVSFEFKGAGTTSTQILTIIGFWLLGITNFFLGVCRAPTKGRS